jgi:hypothetical protein
VKNWIRIRIEGKISNDLDSVVDPDPHHFGNFDPYSHQIKIRIRIKVVSWIRNRIRINLQMTSQNVWNMSRFEHFFKWVSLYLEAMIWIRIRIRVKILIRIRINKNTDPDLHPASDKNTDPELHLDPHR